jgi:hypothetical protein
MVPLGSFLQVIEQIGLNRINELANYRNYEIQVTKYEKMNLEVALDENGNHISPKLPQEVKNFLIDIDGTICDDIPNEEPERMEDAVIYEGALDMINKWFEEGHIITFFTSRTEEHRPVTERWLAKHGFNYHGILFGKPRGGNYHWIDNHIVRATRYEGKFTELVMADAKIQVFKG